MNKYTVTIVDEHFGELSGEFVAVNEDAAKPDAQQFYAEELGTSPDDIEVVDVTLVE